MACCACSAAVAFLRTTSSRPAHPPAARSPRSDIHSARAHLPGRWQEFHYWWVFAIAGLGGLGPPFSVPLRRSLVVEQKMSFPKPSGRGSPESRSGSRAGSQDLAVSALAGGAMKFAAASGLRLIPTRRSTRPTWAEGLPTLAPPVSALLASVHRRLQHRHCHAQWGRPSPGTIAFRSTPLFINTTRCWPPPFPICRHRCGGCNPRRTDPLSRRRRHVIGGVWALISIEVDPVGIKSGLAASAPTSRRLCCRRMRPAYEVRAHRIVAFTLPLAAL